mgnify:CR=1 FL=1
MKRRYPNLATGLLLGLAIGLPAQGLAAQHESGMMQGGGEKAMESSGGNMAMDEGTPVSKSVGFGTLDVNRDGYLSKEEADKSARISGSWDSADSNNDGRVDRAEFSAFEADEMSGKETMDDPMRDDGRK